MYTKTRMYVCLFEMLLHQLASNCLEQMGKGEMNDDRKSLLGRALQKITKTDTECTDSNRKSTSVCSGKHMGSSQHVDTPQLQFYGKNDG